MIKIIEKEDIQIVSKYVWNVYQDENKRTTPPYKSFDQVEDSLLRFLADEQDEIIAVYKEDELKGIAMTGMDLKNKYFSIKGPYIDCSDDYMSIASEIMDYLELNYKGFKCDFGTTRANTNSQKFLISKGFACTEDTVQMSIIPNQLIDLALEHNIQLLTDERKDEYRNFHDTHFHNYYWLADGIYSVMDRWKVHVLIEQDRIVGSVFTMRQRENSGEVYGCEILEPYKNEQVMAELFHISTKSWMDEGVNEIINFVPEGIYSTSASMVGYEGYDTYMCFSKEEI
ncbi:MAG: hypothetical protein JEZ08_02105 [Clostridiales bacterium]|nr:hypothetical protein [Clostridiales bacterium]